MAWMAIILVIIVSMAVAGRMAHARGRSTRAWLWVSAFVGPFGPLALYLLGNRHGKASRA
jgi:NO-binding membrane sensor protein with MHYT domain